MFQIAMGSAFIVGMYDGFYGPGTGTFLILILITKLDSKGPVFFVQTRMGRNRRPFRIYKFRTMKVNAPNVPTHQLEDPALVTRFGRFMRKSSLDEIPQIVNILLGQMSMIGPRPVIEEENDGVSNLIEEREKVGANSVRPGLTGLAQINGRDELPIEVKAKLDGEYVEKMSFLFDMKCFFGTIVKVIRREGVVEGRQEQERQREKITK